MYMGDYEAFKVLTAMGSDTERQGIFRPEAILSLFSGYCHGKQDGGRLRILEDLLLWSHNARLLKGHRFKVMQSATSLGNVRLLTATIDELGVFAADVSAESLGAKI